MNFLNELVFPRQKWAACSLLFLHRFNSCYLGSQVKDSKRWNDWMTHSTNWLMNSCDPRMSFWLSKANKSSKIRMHTSASRIIGQSWRSNKWCCRRTCRFVECRKIILERIREMTQKVPFNSSHFLVHQTNLPIFAEEQFASRWLSLWFIQINKIFMKTNQNCVN